MHGKGPTREGQSDEVGHQAPVVGPHFGAEGIEDARYACLQALDAVVGRREGLGVAFGLVVGAADACGADALPR